MSKGQRLAEARSCKRPCRTRNVFFIPKASGTNNQTTELVFQDDFSAACGQRRNVQVRRWYLWTWADQLGDNHSIQTKGTWTAMATAERRAMGRPKRYIKGKHLGVATDLNLLSKYLLNE